MLTRDEIQRVLLQLSQSPAHFHDVWAFGPESGAFDTPASEETICLFRGARTEFLSPAHFWLHSLSSASECDWQNATKIARSVICKPISRDELSRRVCDKSGRVASRIGLESKRLLSLGHKRLLGQEDRNVRRRPCGRSELRGRAMYCPKTMSRGSETLSDEKGAKDFQRSILPAGRGERGSDYAGWNAVA